MNLFDRVLSPTVLVLAIAAVSIVSVSAAEQDEDVPPRIDYLTFAEGAIPLAINGPDGNLGPDAEDQIAAIDGSPFGFSYLTTEEIELPIEFTYGLPAPTIFDRFAVPWVLETPSPFQTFTRDVEVWGSSVGPDEGYELLASATLQTHDERGEFTELAIHASPAVSWVRLRLRGGTDVQTERTGFEFSEIIGNGTQETRPQVEHFTGAWDSRFVKMELVQEGALVSGCYDNQGVLSGTVQGNILTARGVDQGGAMTESLFILSVLPDGSLTGVRSSNGGPFRLYTGPEVDDVARLDCLQPPVPPACGSVIHGIQFGYDSAVIRPESAPVLEALYSGLAVDDAAAILIRGHTSSEGSDQYNRDLSARRAQSVVDDLIRRGLDMNRVRAVGAGEDEPIATNDNEAGRSLNRRVEIECT